MDSWAILTWFGAGVIVAGILGFVSQQIRLSRAQMDAYRRPQNVAHQTNQTPQQVAHGSIIGTFGCLVWTVAFFAVLGGVAIGLYWFLFA